MPILPTLSQWSSSVSLDAAGLVALADLSTVAKRTALTGTSDILDCLVLCPGLHRQQTATYLSRGEIPPMAAMMTGYICRVENPAMVSYLQQIGRTGQLTVVKVQKLPLCDRARCPLWRRVGAALISCPSACATVAYCSIVLLTCLVLTLLALAEEWWGVGVVGALIFARLCNIVVIRRRNTQSWHGASEPGIQGDNLVLLTQDRWVRLRGDLDDLKAVTAGQWLREPTFFERAAVAMATVLVYLTAALASNVHQAGKVAMLVLLLLSAGLLSIVNELTDTFRMHGRLVSVEEPRMRFERRLSMVSSLIAEVGRADWAFRMGLLVGEETSLRSKTSDRSFCGSSQYTSRDSVDSASAKAEA